MLRILSKFSWLLAVGLLVSFACNYRPMPPSVPAASTGPVLATQTVPAAFTSPAPRLLTICMGQEPTSLFLYADASAAARSIRQAIYDGPYDIVNYDLSPVILENKPSLADGSLALEAVEVQPGASIVDKDGRLVKLAEGVGYLPAGCNDAGCAAVYSGQQPVQMDRLAARFKLKSGLQWSDNSPLTADDSVFSYEVARSLYPRARAELLEHTSSYQALDETNLVWQGVPGYRSAAAVSAFFTPLPRHAWGGLASADLLTAEAVNRKPLGWGPYVIDEWTGGDHITLSRNPAYFRSAQGLPAFDRLVFRFVPDREQALAALLAGECDMLDESLHLEGETARLAELESSGKVSLVFQPGTAWEHIDFGLISAKDPANGGPLPLFQAKEVRQAVGQCIDRQRMASELFAGKSEVPDSYVPNAHPLFNPDVKRYSFDPQAAAASLEALGWTDNDANPATPRLSKGIPGLADGTPFEFNFLTTDEPEKLQAAKILQESLAQCGIKADIDSLTAQALFVPGPEGPVFGRNFSSAQYGWVTALEPPCFLYTTQEIPGSYPAYPKGWGGANAAGYSNAEFDRACQQAQTTLPETPEHRDAHFQAQAIFTQDLPALPLYQRLKLVVTRPELCGVTVDPSSDTALWNLENFGADCP
jgi:peptide/nickel transport system substrate-binding protein